MKKITSKSKTIRRKGSSAVSSELSESQATGESGTNAETAGSERKYRIFLVDDHPILLQGLVDLINRQKDLEVCGQASRGSEAMEKAPRLKPDLTLVDITLKDGNGIELIKSLKAFDPSMKMMVLSMHDERLYAERALRAGARGYIMKEEASENIVSAIQTVMKGEIYLSDHMKKRMLHHLVDGPPEEIGFSLDKLSDRELEVYQLIGNGYGTRQIAEKLNLSVKTIESYRESLKQKLKFADGQELVRHAIQWNKSQDSMVQ